MIAAHRRQAAAARDRTDILTAAWQRALGHAAVPFRGLDLACRETDAQEHVALATALEALPEHGLIAVLEDRDGARGLLAISHGLIDALVELQTTGRVDPRELPPRPVTRIDEALCRDFIDLSLAAFSRETQTVEDRDWPQRMNFGSRIADRRQLNLLLADGTCHLLSAVFDLGEDAARQGQAVLIVPRTRMPSPRAAVPGDSAAPEAWRAALEAAMAEAPLRLDAVLIRTTRSLGQVEALGPGDLIEFDPSDLSEVRLESPSGEAIFRGRLGQMNGQRALRMADSSADSAAAAPMRPEEAAPDDPVPGAGLPQAAALQALPAAEEAPAVEPGDASIDPADAPEPDLPMPPAEPLDFTPASVPIDPGAFPQ